MRARYLHVPAPVLLILPILFVAGCLGQSTISSLFGSDVIKPSVSVQTSGAADVLVLENIRTLPEKVVIPGEQGATRGQPVKLFMNLVSKEQDPTKSVTGAGEIFDAGVFKNSEGVFCNKNADCYPNDCGLKGTSVSTSVVKGMKLCTLQAGEVKPIEFSMFAPSRDDIANIITKSKINYRVFYSYKSNTNYEAVVVSYNEVLRLQQEGKTLSLPVQDTRGEGPIQIEISSLNPFWLQGQPIFFQVKVKNVGSGSLANREVPVNGLTVKFPTEFGSEESIPSDTFTNTGNNVFVNSKKSIEIFKKESSPYLFRFSGDPGKKDDTETTLGEAPYRTFLATAHADYSYELRGFIEMEVRPTQIAR